MALVKNKTYYTYQDVTIVPGEVSNIEHRSECIPLDENFMLPLFTAPMDTVVNENNYKLFNDEMIYPILPRTVSLDIRIEYSIKNRWAAYSLSEFETIFCDSTSKLDESNGISALIDIANGHMKKLLDLIRASKNIYGNKITLMVGNIANPKTFLRLSEAGADFIRCGVGSGCGCLSTSNTGIHMPMASLIDEIATLKQDYNLKAKIIADGGIRNYSDIIKALALGAVKFNELKNISKLGRDWYGEYNGKRIFLGDLSLTFYGMASMEGQIALNGAKTKTSEGTRKTLLVEYTMHGWCNNFMDYLRSAMSYVGVKTLNEFKKEPNVIVNSQNAILVVNK